jgi:hypothetical protein
MAQFSEKIIVAGNFIRHYNYTKPMNTGFTRKTEFNNKRLHGEKRPDSLTRTRNSFIEYIETNKTPYMKLLTLTTKEPIYNEQEFRKHLQTFFRAFNNYFDISIRYAYVLEGQKTRQQTYSLPDAPLHAHILIFNNQKFPWQSVKKLWSLGVIDIHKIKKVKHIGRYMAKYLTKETIALNKKGFIRSANLTKAQTVRTVHPFPWNTPDWNNYYHFSMRGPNSQLLSDINGCHYNEYHDLTKLEPLVNLDTGELITPKEWVVRQAEPDYNPLDWILESHFKSSQ